MRSALLFTHPLQKSESIKAAQALSLGLIDAVVDKVLKSTPLHVTAPDVLQEADLIARAAQLALDIAAGRKPRVRAMFKSDKLQNRDGALRLL